MIQKKFLIVNCFFWVICGFTQESFQIRYSIEPKKIFLYLWEQQDSLQWESQNPSGLFSRMKYAIQIDFPKSKNKIWASFSLDSLWTFPDPTDDPIAKEEKAWRKKFQSISFSSEITEKGQILSKNAPFYFFWLPLPDTTMTLNMTWPFHSVFQNRETDGLRSEWEGTIQAFDLIQDSVAIFHFEISRREWGKTVIPEPFRKMITIYEAEDQGNGMAYFNLKLGKIERVFVSLKGNVHIKKEEMTQKYSRITRIFIKAL